MSHEQPHEEILRARTTGFPYAGAFAPMELESLILLSSIVRAFMEITVCIHDWWNPWLLVSFPLQKSTGVAESSLLTHSWLFWQLAPILVIASSLAISHFSIKRWLQETYLRSNRRCSSHINQKTKGFRSSCARNWRETEHFFCHRQKPIYLVHISLCLVVVYL